MKFHVSLSLSLILFIAALPPAVHADIYKCKDEHGNVAYLQTPCPVEKKEDTSATDDDAQTAKALQDDDLIESSPEPQSPDVETPSSRLPGEPLDDCKKRFRDQIDEIDAKMRTGFSSEQGKAYKERLLALTKQLRACR
jgi:hypothetical protein